MTTKKYQQKLLKHRICSVARIIACASFLVLTVIGISSLVSAMELKENVDNKNGVPASWEAAAKNGRPSKIEVPITYWDQRQDQCWVDEDDEENLAKADMVTTNSGNYTGPLYPERQFEWVECGIYAHDVAAGLVKDTLGSDGLPQPAYSSHEALKAAGIDVTSQYVYGDNFYKWFHTTDRSQEIIGHKVTFQQQGKTNTYKYGNRGVFPIDGEGISDKDETTIKYDGRNFHYTAHLQFAMRVGATGEEKFEFVGDDDVWVFLNNRLVLDIGGLHEALKGYFVINQDGTITSYTQSKLESGKMTDKTFDIGLKRGDVVNLDFFYAERSTSESNMEITVTNMKWPITAEAKVAGTILGKNAATDTNYVQYESSLQNQDPSASLEVHNFAAFINDVSDKATNSGFIPLTVDKLEYSLDRETWTALSISTPEDSLDGFKFAAPITLSRKGGENDTLYLRYAAETNPGTGKIATTVSYYTEMSGAGDVAYATTSNQYTSAPVTPDPKPEGIVIIKHVYEDGTPVAELPNKTITGTPGDPVPAYTSPSIPGKTEYSPDPTGITDETFPEDGQTKEITVTYKKTETPVPTRPVTIRHLEEGTDKVLHDPTTNEYPVGTEYPINAEKISGYTPKRDGETGIVTDFVPKNPNETDPGIVEIIYYTKNATTPSNPTTPSQPENPDTPTSPTTPTEPTTPSEPITPSEPTTPDNPLPDIPIIPNDSFLDDGLIYLAPLGEIAFVPNTGIVSSYATPLFNDIFADIIMSQGFVLAMLLIFAGSFATYFSLRQYMNLEAATRSVRKAPKMPTSRKALAKSIQKTSRGASKTASAKRTMSKATTSRASSRSAKSSKK